MLTNKECDHCPIVKPFHPKEIREHEDCLPHFCHVVHPRGIEGVAAICMFAKHCLDILSAAVSHLSGDVLVVFRLHNALIQNLANHEFQVLDFF